MKIPVATYRLQFNSQFPFTAAAKIIDYLSDLGVSDIYASPILKSKKGSTHGYDVLDSSQINPELGGVPEFEQVLNQTRGKNLGWIQDIVPNHMAYDSENKLLMDIFENGPLSAYAQFFDIEFEHPYENLKHRILAPFLGEFYGHCLDKNQIQLKFNEQGFFIQYFDWIFPLRIDSYLNLLTYDLSLLTDKLGQGNENLLKFLETTQILKNLVEVKDPQERTRQIILVKSRLWQFYSENGVIHDYVDHSLNTINGANHFADLDKLLSDQFFRLAFWKVGNEELNYRRFFTINSLVCLRMERAEVFEYTHRFIFKLIEEKKLTGLRVDHLDGLYDPSTYLTNLKKRSNSSYIIVEKILDMQEELPGFFPVEGTTGYDFLNFVNGIFVDCKNMKKMNKAFVNFTGNDTPYEEQVLDKKKHFIGKHMAGDIDNLAQLLKGVLNRNRYGKDLTMYGLKRALVEIMAQFPVYRTYINGEVLSDNDKIYIKDALARAKNTNPGSLYELDAIEKILLLNFDPDIRPEEKVDWLHFIKRFQQFTGPLMAKALEDTVFYVYNRLISLNEVGGDPSVFGVSLKEFHGFNVRRAQKWPHTLNATSTHDTKRGEDLRARINVLSEIPKEWMTAVRVWSKMNRTKKKSLDHVKAPDNDDEYFIYQTLVGAFPLEDEHLENFTERLQAYIVKAIREAKIHTAWIKPDLEYEQGCMEFIKEILQDSKFLESFRPLQKKVAHFGIFNSLSQTLIKLTSPGIPDFYQGSELWDLNLVDPDNRRPVDYEKRKEFLGKIKDQEKDISTLIADLWEQRVDGRIKLFLIYHALSARSEFPTLFSQGQYMPLKVIGERENHIVAFARQHEQQWAITVAPRFLATFIKENELPLGDEVWKDTAVVLPKQISSKWRDSFTSQEFIFENVMKVGALFNKFPAALLINK